jgi:hypothetical protein
MFIPDIVTIIVVFLIFIYCVIYYKNKDSFSAEYRASKICDKTMNIFKNEPTYEKYKQAMKGEKVDAVEYTAIKELYRSGRFNKESVAKELLDINPKASALTPL